MGLPYRTILVLACVVLTVRYALDTRAPVAGRWRIGILTVASLLVPDSLAWTIASVIVQLGVSLFVLLHMKVLAE